MIRLPTELHDEILQHLNRKDVASYRLIGRRCAIAAAPYLFERLHFRTSLESLHCLAKISKHEYGHYVKHLMWNTMGSEFDTKAFLEGLRMRELKYVLGHPDIRAATRSTQQAEIERVNHDHSSITLGVFLLAAIFSGFPSLTGIYILGNSSSSSVLAEDDGWAIRSNERPESDSWPEIWKVGSGYPRWRGPRQTVECHGRYEAQVAVLAAQSIYQPLCQLRIENLCFRNAKIPPALPGFERALENLTHLELVLDGPDKALDEVKRLFQTINNIRVLKLWLHANSWWDDGDRDIPVLALQNIFPGTESFPHLQELELHQLSVGQEFLTDFLLAHAPTLEVLRLHCILMHTGGSWMALFTSIRGRMEKLASVGLYGGLHEEPNLCVWDMDSLVGRGSEAYILERDERRANELRETLHPIYVFD